VFQVLTAYCNMLNILRPAKAPGFAYAWLEIVSHRVFIGRILSLTPQQKGMTTPNLSAVLWDGDPDPKLFALANRDPN
jgi:CCR4-NOT transcription complex subunit 1